jgi:hypothetical protein
MSNGRDGYLHIVRELLLLQFTMFYQTREFDPFILNNYQICGIFDNYNRKRHYRVTRYNFGG